MKEADPHCQPAADWRLSNHRDAIGRRMLMVRNFKNSAHDNASHQASREIAEAANDAKVCGWEFNCLNANGSHQAPLTPNSC